jgi:hypothetical protein
MKDENLRRIVKAVSLQCSSGLNYVNLKPIHNEKAKNQKSKII